LYCNFSASLQSLLPAVKLLVVLGHHLLLLKGKKSCVTAQKPLSVVLGLAAEAAAAAIDFIKGV
jgi:hypothetical protein